LFVAVGGPAPPPAAWVARAAAEQVDAASADERFLVVGEELTVPKELLGRLDGLWNEEFKRIARAVILGRNADGEPSFEWSVRKLIDCRLLGFARGDQAVNYLCSHDVGGWGNERLHDYLGHNGVALKETRIVLAFACLLTAVGIPMILAGEEFADQQDYVQQTDDNKQIDPVNFDRMGDPWRQRIFDRVARLVRLRTGNQALAGDDIEVIHVDFSAGKRVLVWRRGRPDGADAVVVVANFSAWGTPDADDPAARYDIPGWPATPAHRHWREVTADRVVAPGMAGHEPLFPWEAKVYVLV
jgi:pullulanase